MVCKSFSLNTSLTSDWEPHNYYSKKKLPFVLTVRNFSFCVSWGNAGMVTLHCCLQENWILANRKIVSQPLHISACLCFGIKQHWEYEQKERGWGYGEYKNTIFLLIEGHTSLNTEIQQRVGNPATTTNRPQVKWHWDLPAGPMLKSETRCDAAQGQNILHGHGKIPNRWEDLTSSDGTEEDSTDIDALTIGA